MDLPAFGARSRPRSRIAYRSWNRPSVEERLRGDLLRGALGARLAAFGLEPLELDLHDEQGRVSRPAAPDLDVARRGERGACALPAPPSLRRARARRRIHPRAPRALYEVPRRLVPAVEKTPPMSDFRQISERIATFLRPPARTSPCPITTCGPTSHSSATAAQVSRRTSLASRIDNSPSLACGYAA